MRRVNMLFDNNFDFGFFKIPGSDFNLESREDKFLTPEEGLFLINNILILN